MTLPALQYRKITPQTPAAFTCEGVLDAIYAAFQTTLYADGITTRTPGSGSAWSMTRYRSGGTLTEAVYGAPPSGSITDLDVIIAGVDAGAPTPTIASPDTFGISYLFLGLNKDGTSFNAWDNSAPFTAGNFSGYWKGTQASVYGTTVHIYESQEDFYIFCESATGLISCMRVGAIVDPQTTDPADSEVNGRLYGMALQGPGGLSTNLWDQNGVFFHNVSANAHHCGVFNPRIGTLATLRTHTELSPIGNSTQFITRGGSPVLFPVSMRELVSPFRFAGRLRDCYQFGEAKFGQVIQDSGANTKFYMASGSVSAAGYIAMALPL